MYVAAQRVMREYECIYFLTDTDVWPYRWLVNDTLIPRWKANHIFIISWVNEVNTRSRLNIRLRVWRCATLYSLGSVCVPPVICSRSGWWERGGLLCRTTTWVHFQYSDTLAKHVNRIMCIVWSRARYAHTSRDAQPYVRSLTTRIEYNRHSMHIRWGFVPHFHSVSWKCFRKYSPCNTNHTIAHHKTHGCRWLTCIYLPMPICTWFCGGIPYKYSNAVVGMCAVCVATEQMFSKWLHRWNKFHGNGSSLCWIIFDFECSVANAQHVIWHNALLVPMCALVSKWFNEAIRLLLFQNQGWTTANK